MSAKYLVDSNFWITCENELYPRRHFPSFWVERDYICFDKGDFEDVLVEALVSP
jgi:hypothetical protein